MRSDMVASRQRMAEAKFSPLPRGDAIELPREPVVAALGGGHGLAASLSALRLLTQHLTGIVTVADDGGSSGRLREELDVLPPGDLRMALAALCDSTEWGRTWRDLLQYRFHTDGALDNHAVGNVLIVALWEILGDPVAGLDLVGKLLGARGRVLPMAAVPLEIEADVIGLDPDDPTAVTQVRGQSQVAITPGEVRAIRLIPERPAVLPETLAAITEADWVVLGPGSWFTSVLPHLSIPELSQALHATSAKRCLTMNLCAQAGETDGFSAVDHLAALHDHAPDFRIDVVLADPCAVEDVQGLADLAGAMGGEVVLRNMSVGDGTMSHDALRLAAAYRDVFDGVRKDVV